MFVVIENIKFMEIKMNDFVMACDLKPQHTYARIVLLLMALVCRKIPSNIFSLNEMCYIRFSDNFLCICPSQQ